MLPESDSSSYKKFRKNVFIEVEEAEIYEDETYPTALFIVDREDESEVYTVQEIAEEYELDEDTELSEVIHEIMPEKVSTSNAKFFALVFPGDYEGDEDSPIVAVLLGALFHSEIYYSTVSIDNKGLCYIDGWEAENPQEYPELSIPYRRAITLQG